MDIRKFFGAVAPGNKHQHDAAEKNVKPINKRSPSGEKSKLKEIKVKNPSCERDSKQKLENKKKRIIYDSDSEEEIPIVKRSKKQPDGKPSTKPDKILRKDPVVYVSETDEDEDFVNKKVPPKHKENGASASSHVGIPGTSKEDSKPKIKNKPLSPVKLTPTSVIDYFGTSTVQRSEKKLVSSKRKECSQNRDPTLSDEGIAKKLQIEENIELERQLHEDEEFARTLAMLDEAPKRKKPRKDAEEKQIPSTAKTSAKDTDKKKLTSKESAGSLNSHPESSVSKEKKDFGDQVQSGELSSKVALLKQKEDSVKVENRTPRGKNIKKESASPGGETVSPKEEKTSKKTKSSPSKPTSVSPEDSDKKRINYQAYRSFLNREGPKALGSKEIPQGGENCLEGLTFVITGVLESIERDETKSLIERYGGKVTGNISKKTNYLVKGRDYGAAKCEKASVLGTKIIDEDGLFDLIRNMPGKKSKYEVAAEAEAKRAKSTPEKAEVEKRKTSPAKREGECKKSSVLAKEDTFRFSKKEPVEARRGLDFSQKSPEEKQVAQNDRNQDKERRKGGGGGGEALLWVDKYKPTSLKMIIGQQGEQSCANKLLRWLQNWHRNTSEDKHVKPSKFGSKDDGSSFKAALLSGPPGVGKTTTASLVCKELGLSYVELNASDTRSKSSLKDVVAESLNNTSIKDFCSGASSSVSRNHVLIMDEVDGMAGNEDRGGIQELIDLIKHTKIPIICMCNDRNHQKMRSLVHYCFDLRFFRPRVEQIKGAMMTIAFKEGLKIPPPAMNEIILAANQDIRQVLHNLSMWCSKSKSLTYDGVKEDASKAKKDIKLGPFDVVKKVFSTEEASRMSLIDKSDLFFHDYSLGPLFVQENYIHVKPAAAGGNMKKHLMLLSKAADGICDGDLVDQQIRRQQNWNLLPTQAIYSSVLPGELMRGYMHQFPSFPSWLGKFSSTGKHDRIVQELSMHMSLRTHASKRAVNLDYLPYLRDAIVNPLISLGRDGVQHAVAIMDSYYLTKEDVENIMEITTWGGNASAFSAIDSKVKSAFTRVYNKETHLAPYSLKTVPKLKQRAGSTVDEETEVDEEQSVTEQETVENDAMIKKKSGLSSKQKPKERKK